MQAVKPIFITSRARLAVSRLFFFGFGIYMALHVLAAVFLKLPYVPSFAAQMRSGMHGSPAGTLGVFVLLALNLLFQKSPKQREWVKNTVLAALASFALFFIAIPFGISSFPILSFPIFLTILFGSRRTTCFTALLNAVLTAVLLLFTRGTLPEGHLWVLPLKLYGILLFALLLSLILTKAMQEAFDAAEKGYKRQLELTDSLHKDMLTGLYNQTAFFEQLKAGVFSAKQSGRPFSMAILDIDNFKRINDTFGHSAGNEVLLDIANLLAQRFSKPGVSAARYGGEEFCVVFFQSDLKRALAEMDELRRTLAQKDRGPVQHVTVSIGVAQYKQEEDMLSLFNRADSALYQAKREGKNQTKAG